MPNKVKQSVSLYFREGTSDKQYNVLLLETNGGYLVHGQNGRRGGTMTLQVKTPVPVSLRVAEKIYEDLVREKKVKKGYTEGQSAVQSFQ